VPLVTVELGFHNNFDLQPKDADVLVQLRGQDVIWQTERLFNVALESVPAACDQVAWIDCDMIFGRSDWAAQASELLKHRAMVQLFSHLYELPAESPDDDLSRSEFSAYSFANFQGRGPALFQDSPRKARRSRIDGAPGGAWAARRDVLKKHGFYDALVLGGGDEAVTYAAVGWFEKSLANHLANARQKQHYLEWAVPFFHTVRGNIVCVEGDLHHLWHGELSKRSYSKRHQNLVPFGFDPYADISVAENGSWRWNSAKPALHQYVQSYFMSREEDG